MPKAKPAPVKPVKLQLNNSGAWKDIVRFDAGDDECAGEVMEAAKKLSDAVNAGLERPQFTLRIVTDDGDCAVLAQYKGFDGGWRDARTGDPV